MKKKCRLFIKLHHPGVVYSQQFIHTGHFGYGLVFAFRLLLDNELVNRVILRLMCLEGLHDLVTGLTQVSCPTF